MLERLTCSMTGGGRISFCFSFETCSMTGGSIISFCFSFETCSIVSNFVLFEEFDISFKNKKINLL
jgi:hypothetical protein